jgi:hypothetical protein
MVSCAAGASAGPTSSDSSSTSAPGMRGSGSRVGPGTPAPGAAARGEHEDEDGRRSSHRSRSRGRWELLSFLLLYSVRLFTSTTAPHAACIIVFKPTETLTECCHVCTLDVAKASRSPVAWRVWEIPPEESAGTSSLAVGRTAHTLPAPTHRAHRPARRRRRSSRRWETRSWSCCFPSIHPLS